MADMELLHGSEKIIERPDINLGNIHNDYGRGFYCTRDMQMAGEWACKQNTDGFINKYLLDQSGLKELNLADGNHTVLNWIALLLKYRTFRLSSEIAVDTREYLIEHYSIDTSTYDVIIGYRADDSYFQYAEAFVENGLSLRSLNQAMRLGRMGLQTVLVSQKAFDQLRFVEAIPAEKMIYYPQFLSRDKNARDTYRSEIKKSRSYRGDIFALDILREEMSNDDPRIQRILFE